MTKGGYDKLGSKKDTQVKEGPIGLKKGTIGPKKPRIMPKMCYFKAKTERKKTYFMMFQPRSSKI